VATFGTAIAADGTASEIPPQQISSQALSSWTSPVTGGVYPSGWRVTIAGRSLSLTLTPLLRDQELVTARSTGVAYWEGAVAVSGTVAGARVTGEGYVELTGYASVPASAGSPAAP
jgi:predicted secreted hydrolase